jgi:hypothetical protein
MLSEHPTAGSSTGRLPMSTPDHPLADHLVRLGQRLSAVQHELVTAVARFAAGTEWTDQAPTAAHWIADHLDVHLGTAREWIRIGSALADLPSVEQAFREGRLSYSKIRVLSRIAAPENEEELVEIAEAVPAAQLASELAIWANDNEEPDRRDARQHANRRLSTWVDVDGMVCGFFRLPPVEGGAVVTALRHAIRRRVSAGQRASRLEGAPADASSGWPSLPQQRADALVECVTGRDSNRTTEIVVHLRGDGTSLDDGTPITSTALERLAPDAFFRALIHDAEGRPINVSRRRRHPDARQRRLVRERDRVCVDCGSSELLEFDHVPDHRITGRTTTDELQLRCAPCHRRRHGQAA